MALLRLASTRHSMTPTRYTALVLRHLFACYLFYYMVDEVITGEVDLRRRSADLKETSAG